MCAQAGIRITISLTNYWPEFGGIGWYVRNIVGNTGQPQELFYTDTRVIAAYRTWVRKLATRVNTVNGRRYSEDPTIFSWCAREDMLCHNGFHQHCLLRAPPPPMMHSAIDTTTRIP